MNEMTVPTPPARAASLRRSRVVGRPYIGYSHQETGNDWDEFVPVVEAECSVDVNELK